MSTLRSLAGLGEGRVATKKTLEQCSPRYPGGVALGLARSVNFRPDKPPEAIDMIQSLRALRNAGSGG